MPIPSTGFHGCAVMLLAGLLNQRVLAIPLSRPARPGTGTGAASLAVEDEAVALEQGLGSWKCDASSLPLYVINLDGRGAKLNKFAERLPAPLKACRVTGVNGSALPWQMDPKLISASAWGMANWNTRLRVPVLGTLLTKGAVGLALAHARAWAHMIERGEQVALIAEDDLFFYVPNAIKQIEGACEVTRLWGTPKQILLSFCKGNSTLGGWPKPFSPQANFTDEQVMRTRQGRLDEARLAPIEGEDCQGFYLLTNAGARVMLRWLFPIAMQIDAGVQAHRLYPYFRQLWAEEEKVAAQIHTWSPYWGAARAPELETYGLFPPIAQCDDRAGYSDAQQGWFYSRNSNDTAVGSDKIEACGGLASLGTSNDAASLLEYFRDRIGTW